MKKGRLAVAILVVLALSALLFTGCVSKKSSTPTSSPTTESALEKRIASLESIIPGLQSKVDGVINQNYGGTISSLQGSLNSIRDEINSSVDSKLATVDSKLAAFQPEMPDVPEYVLVNSLSSRFVEVTVYGAGDFPVLVILYGEGLQINQAIADEDDDYDIVSEFLYGQKLVTSVAPWNVTIPGGLYTSGDAIGDPPPNAHVHKITIPDTTVSFPKQQLEGAGTMLVIVVEPDGSWAQNSTFELDIRDVGDVYYAAAVIGYAD